MKKVATLFLAVFFLNVLMINGQESKSTEISSTIAQAEAKEAKAVRKTVEKEEKKIKKADKKAKKAEKEQKKEEQLAKAIGNKKKSIKKK